MSSANVKTAIRARLDALVHVIDEEYLVAQQTKTPDPPTRG